MYKSYHPSYHRKVFRERESRRNDPEWNAERRRQEQEFRRQLQQAEKPPEAPTEKKEE